MDLRRRTRRKSSTLSFARLDLSSCYYLKNLKLDISQTGEISYAMFVSAVDAAWRTIWIADAHRDDGKRFVIRGDERLRAFVYLGVPWVMLFWAESLSVSSPMMIAPPPNGGSGFIGKRGRKTANACDASASETSMNTAARFILAREECFRIVPRSDIR